MFHAFRPGFVRKYIPKFSLSAIVLKRISILSIPTDDIHQHLPASTSANSRDNLQVVKYLLFLIFENSYCQGPWGSWSVLTLVIDRRKPAIKPGIWVLIHLVNHVNDWEKYSYLLESCICVDYALRSIISTASPIESVPP